MVVSGHLARLGGDHRDQEGLVNLFERPAVAWSLKVLALAEFAADKLPFAGARTAVPAMLVRATSGGLSGAALTLARRQGWVVGALFGSLAAVASSVVTYRARRWICRTLPVPDRVIGVVEDGFVLAAGRMLVRDAIPSRPTSDAS